jgi:hypothetical protein
MASSIKVSYEGEMRRFAASTYEALQQRVASLFDLDTFLLKYQDEEGDLVTVSSEWELEEALRCNGPVLRLNVEATDDRQSGDFILVERDCVVHVDQSGDTKPDDAFPSPLATEQVSQQASQATPMALTPLPQTTTTQQSTQPQNLPVQDLTSSSVPTAGAKRSYAEACESKTPYLQGAHKVPTYIISVSNSGANPRSHAKPHAVTSTATTPYVQAADVRAPYARGKDGPEFTQTPKVSAPYAQGKSSPAYVRPVEDSHYVSQSRAAKPFTQVK